MTRQHGFPVSRVRRRSPERVGLALANPGRADRPATPAKASKSRRPQKSFVMVVNPGKEHCYVEAGRRTKAGPTRCLAHPWLGPASLQSGCAGQPLLQGAGATLVCWTAVGAGAIGAGGGGGTGSAAEVVGGTTTVVCWMTEGFGVTVAAIAGVTSGYTWR